MSKEELLAEIQGDAARARSGGRLPADYEADLDTAFIRIASEVEPLSKGVAAGELAAPQAFRLAGPVKGASGSGDVRCPGRPGRRSAAALAAKSLSRRGLTKARRLAGPRLRSAERASIEGAGRLAEQLATRAHVLGDQAQRMTGGSSLANRLARMSPRERALPGGVSLERSRPSPLAGGSWELEDWAFERLKQAAEGAVLHVECGDGNFVRRLSANGLDAAGADPAAPESPPVRRAGALEALGRTPKGSLAGLVLSGVTERLNAGSARALVHLAATRLHTGGTVIIVSAHPSRQHGGDVVSADLAGGRALHPVTWCHLLARYGFGEITVRESDDDSGYYGVTARRA